MGQLFQKMASNPMSQTQFLAAANNVRKVGTGVIGGVPVTEYTGTISMTMTMRGTSLDEALGMLVSEINQPVSIAIPPAAQTATMPANALAG